MAQSHPHPPLGKGCTPAPFEHVEKLKTLPRTHNQMKKKSRCRLTSPRQEGPESIAIHFRRLPHTPPAGAGYRQ